MSARAERDPRPFPSRRAPLRLARPRRDEGARRGRARARRVAAADAAPGLPPARAASKIPSGRGEGGASDGGMGGSGGRGSGGEEAEAAGETPARRPERGAEAVRSRRSTRPTERVFVDNHDARARNRGRPLVRAASSPSPTRFSAFRAPLSSSRPGARGRAALARARPRRASYRPDRRLAPSSLPSLAHLVPQASDRAGHRDRAETDASNLRPPSRRPSYPRPTLFPPRLISTPIPTPPPPGLASTHAPAPALPAIRPLPRRWRGPPWSGAPPS